MAFLGSFNISGSALTAQRFRSDIIMQNIANADTTRTASGQPYRRKMVVLQESVTKKDFSTVLNQKSKKYGANGVKVAALVEDDTPLTPVYRPDHVDADEQGYVMLPNVNKTQESIDLMAATRAYEANITAFNAIKSMANKALEIGR